MTIIDLLVSSNPTFISFCAVLGLMIGSFLNVVIYRLPIMMQRDWRQQCQEFLAEDARQNSALEKSGPNGEALAQADRAGEQEPLSPVAGQVADAGEGDPQPRFNLIKPDSHCPGCNARVRAWQNIPVVSWLLLRGRCGSCGQPISKRYPLIEIITAAVSALVAWQYGPQWATLALLLLSWSLIVLTVIDLDHQLLPDDITLPLLWLGLLFNTIGPAFGSGFGMTAQDAVIGAAAGYLIFWVVYWAFRLLTGKEGMGYGDFKLLAALGAWMGWQSLLPVIILSSLVGAVVGICLLLFLGRDRNVPIPFGPYLAGAGFITLIWGESLSLWYLQTFVQG